jgi:hypothetical protein
VLVLWSGGHAPAFLCLILSIVSAITCVAVAATPHSADPHPHTHGVFLGFPATCRRRSVTGILFDDPRPWLTRFKCSTGSFDVTTYGIDCPNQLTRWHLPHLVRSQFVLFGTSGCSGASDGLATPLIRFSSPLITPSPSLCCGNLPMSSLPLSL